MPKVKTGYLRFHSKKVDNNLILPDRFLEEFLQQRIDEGCSFITVQQTQVEYASKNNPDTYKYSIEVLVVYLEGPSHGTS